MKLAVTAQGQDRTSPIDLRFGRARYFVVADTEDGTARAVDNAQNLNAVQGAGIQSAQNVVDLGVDAVISGNVGPKAFRTLSAAGVRVFLASGGTVQEALDNLAAGTLKEAQKANVDGHW